MKNTRKLNLKEAGITLVALVVTIIVLLILAGVTINLALSNNGIIQRAKDASETYQKAEQNEQQMLSQFADNIDELTGKTALSEDKIAAITNNIKTAETLQEVGYEAKEITDDKTSVAGKGRSVTVEGAYRGRSGDIVTYQSEVGAIGNNKLKWYVLSADEKGVNLVSEVTKKVVQFRDSAGYDNCLYFLNELATKLFANEEYGVTENRIHALRLTDIKKAAEQANVGYKVNDNGTERDWNWDLDVVKASQSITYNNGNVGEKEFAYTDKKDTYYPEIYTANENKEVIASNPMYDEMPGKLTTSIGGIDRKLENETNPADKLVVRQTYFNTNNNASTIERLGRFGTTNIGKELFNSSGATYWVARRYIFSWGTTVEADYGCSRVMNGILDGFSFCSSNGSNSSNGEGYYAFRVVISVPAKNVNVASDGTVTLKAKNS